MGHNEEDIDILCEVCGKPFTEEEWYVHHFDNELVYHEDCCPVCNEEGGCSIMIWLKEEEHA